MSAEITPAAVLHIAQTSRAYEGIRWYEQGIQVSYKAMGGSVLGEVEEPSGGSTYKVWVGITDGKLSYECEECFNEPFSLFDPPEIPDSEARLCVHGAAVAMAAAEAGVTWSESPRLRGLAAALELCPGSGLNGRLDFERAAGDEWHVICHVCGTTWAGGSQTLEPHSDWRNRQTR
ncbi:hypothetical protein GCM10027589_00380 [Actinocorallia lasiicapitis]